MDSARRRKKEGQGRIVDFDSLFSWFPGLTSAVLLRRRKRREESHLRSCMGRS
jgi:hypothetical protein